MSFSSDCKEELCRLSLEKACCRLTEISALYMTLGSLHLLGRSQVKVEFAVENAAIARRVFVLLQKTLGIAPQVHAVTHARFGGIQKYVLTLNPEKSSRLLSHLSMMDLNHHGEAVLKATTPKVNLSRACCARAFLRGVFLGSGTMTQPEHGYHLELTAKEEALQSLIAKALSRFSLPVQKSLRKGVSLFFFTQSEQMVTLLTLLGAHQAVMKLEDLRIRKELFSKVNRAMNCDSANLQKQMNASDQQIEQIVKLISSERFQSLPLSLQEIAKARIHAPDASLGELGQMLHPPLGKSGVNHRMRRLMELAKNNHE